MKALSNLALPVLISLVMIMAISCMAQAQDLALSPASPPNSHGTAIDQGIAYVLMLVALAVTYIFH